MQTRAALLSENLFSRTGHSLQKRGRCSRDRARESGSGMQSMFDERQWLAWLVKVRIIILTFLLGIELAIARLTPHDLRVHRTGVLSVDSGCGHDRRFQRHATFRTLARIITVNIRMHRARVTHPLINHCSQSFQHFRSSMLTSATDDSTSHIVGPSPHMCRRARSV